MCRVANLFGFPGGTNSNDVRKANVIWRKDIMMSYDII